MNSGPNSDSETVLSPKTGWVPQVHSLLTSLRTQARPGVRARAVSWADMAVSWSTADRVMAWSLAVSWPGPRPCRNVCGRVAGAVPHAWLAVS